VLALADTRKENSFTIEVDDFEQLHTSEYINCLHTLGSEARWLVNGTVWIARHPGFPSTRQLCFPTAL
jgi:hypothetical protein